MTNDTFATPASERPTLDSIRDGVRVLPPKVVVYGTAGVGKTTFASSAPDPIVLPTEDGIGRLSVARFPLLSNYDAVMEALRVLYVEETPYQTVVIDALDSLEPLLWARVEQQTGKRVEDHGYGRGYVLAADLWKGVMARLDELRMKKGMGVILIAHADIRSFQSPDNDPFDRYTLRLQKRAQDLVTDWADAVLFANYRVHTVKTESGRTSVTRGIGTGERVLHTAERPAFIAKNRYGLPDELPLAWSAFARAFAAQSGGESK